MAVFQHRRRRVGLEPAVRLTDTERDRVVGRSERLEARDVANRRRGDEGDGGQALADCPGDEGDLDRTEALLARTDVQGAELDERAPEPRVDRGRTRVVSRRASEQLSHTVGEPALLFGQLEVHVTRSGGRECGRR